VVLVLSRKRNEKIVIGDEITVTILEVRGDQVQLGIDAPRRIPVHRFEVYESIRKGNEEASHVPQNVEDGLRRLGDDAKPIEPDDADAPDSPSAGS
jgi:carbon storage regulator